METTPTQEMIAKLIAWIEASADFAKEQWPDYIAQYMKAEAIKSWINVFSYFIAIIVLSSIVILCIRYIWTWEGKSYELPLLPQMGSFIPLVALLPAAACFITEVHNLIMIYIAPKVYILHHLKGFFK